MLKNSTSGNMLMLSVAPLNLEYTSNPLRTEQILAPTSVGKEKFSVYVKFWGFGWLIRIFYAYDALYWVLI